MAGSSNVRPADEELIRRTLERGGCLAGTVSATLLKSFENSVYLVETDDEDHRLSIVRLSRPGEKRYREVRAEIEFVEFLSATGLSVVRPLSAPADLGGSVGTWFEYIAGEQVSTTRRVTSPAAVELGRVMGLMHVAARRFPIATADDRPAWWEAAYFGLDCLASVATTAMISGIRRYMDDVRRHASNELLVHGDLGLGNVIAARTLHIVDFDDCCRAEAEYDLAVALVRMFSGDDSSTTDVDRIVPRLVDGYRSACDQRLDLSQIKRYARILLLQMAIAACRRPDYPGLDAQYELSRAWRAIDDPRALPPVLALALERTSRALVAATTGRP